MAGAGTRLIIAGWVSIALYLCLSAISVFKPWGRTSRGGSGVGPITSQNSARDLERSSA